MGDDHWFAGIGYTEYIAEPVSITLIEGPSPSFVPQWSRGRGLTFALGKRLDQHSALSVRLIWDRLPLGAALNYLPEDHPEFGVRNPLRGANFTYWFRRGSLGLAYRYNWRLGQRASLRAEAGISYDVSWKEYPYHSGIGSIGDTASYWLRGLDARIFPKGSAWRGRLELQYAYTLGRRHAVALGYYVDMPFSNAIIDGRAILLGNSIYRTTVEFHQSGSIQGLALSYEYAFGRTKERSVRRARMDGPAR